MTTTDPFDQAIINATGGLSLAERQHRADETIERQLQENAERDALKASMTPGQWQDYMLDKAMGGKPTAPVIGRTEADAVAKQHGYDSFEAMQQETAS